MKRLLRSDWLSALVCRLGAAYIGLVRRSSRWEHRGDHQVLVWRREGRPFVGAFWHGRMLLQPCAWDYGQPFHMLISSHRDGQFIARVIARLGIRTVAGSTSRGGLTAVRSLVRILRHGECVGITPDGPRGPRMRAAMGVVAVARMAGVPIVPMAGSASRRRVLSSWDRFIVALPFSRGVFVWGSPITVPADADAAVMEAVRRQVEESLNAISAEADRLTGHDPIAPAPLPDAAPAAPAPRPEAGVR